MSKYLYLRFEVEVKLPIDRNPKFEHAWIDMTEEQRAKRALELSRNIAYGWNTWAGQPLGNFLRPTDGTVDLPEVTARHWAMR